MFKDTWQTMPKRAMLSYSKICMPLRALFHHWWCILGILTEMYTSKCHWQTNHYLPNAQRKMIKIQNSDWSAFWKTHMEIKLFFFLANCLICFWSKICDRINHLIAIDYFKNRIRAGWGGGLNCCLWHCSLIWALLQVLPTLLLI